MGQLMKYDVARAALAEAAKIDDVKDIRDKAVGLKEYARQINDADMEKWVAEIKARAERRAGELLQESAIAGNRHTGKGDHKAKSSKSDVAVPQLKDLGISRNQSATWQQIALIPEAKFEKAIATATKPITTKALLALGVKPKKAKKAPEASPALDAPITYTLEQVIHRLLDFVELAALVEPVAPGPIDPETHRLLLVGHRWIDTFLSSRGSK